MFVHKGADNGKEIGKKAGAVRAHFFEFAAIEHGIDDAEGALFGDEETGSRTGDDDCKELEWGGGGVKPAELVIAVGDY